MPKRHQKLNTRRGRTAAEGAEAGKAGLPRRPARVFRRAHGVLFAMALTLVQLGFDGDFDDTPFFDSHAVDRLHTPLTHYRD